MECLKKMSIKKALFVIAFVNMSIALALSLLSVWGCARLRSRIDPGGVVIEMNSNGTILSSIPQTSVQNTGISDGITILQTILPLLIYMAALFATVLLFCHLKIKKPLEVLTDGAAHIIGNDLDFSVEVQSQDELGQLCMAFETMRKVLLANHRELWRQTEERKRLNAAFSHNLRNPVTVLKGSVKLTKNLLEKDGGNRKQLMEHLMRMEAYTSRMEQYVETMSKVQKLEEIPVDPEPVKWDAFILELKNSLPFMGTDRTKEIQVISGEGSESLSIDSSILFQVIENMVSNALRFANKNVDVLCSVSEKKLLVSVSDDGCGFPDAMLVNGIQPFQKGNEEIGHFGMGLYLCQLLCKKHGGSITIQNNPMGATVIAEFNMEI